MQLCPSLMLGYEWSQFGTVAMALIFLVSCLLLILIVLIQKPQGGGLAGAFGSGAGSGQTAFGTRTGDALTVATIAFFVIYLVSAVGMSYVASPAKAVTTQPVATSTDKPGTPAAPGATPPTPPTTPPSTPVQTPPLINSIPVLPATDPATVPGSPPATPGATPGATPPTGPAAVPGTAPAVQPGSTPSAPPAAAPGNVPPDAPKPETPKN